MEVACPRRLISNILHFFVKIGAYRRFSPLPQLTPMYHIKQYNVEENPIAVGGMGRILRGFTPEGQEVAIKEVLPEFTADLEIRYRSQKEIEYLCRLQHPGIVKIYDSFLFDERFYIVMELVHGLDLEHYVKSRGPLDEQRAADIMVKTLSVLQYVHSRHIIHRDIKPSNIMIRDNGEVCLLDFGVARDINSTHTQMGIVIGSDGYMSPEQAEGITLDHRTDIYSLGCVFYFMLTGQQAFPPQASQAEMLLLVTGGKFPKLTTRTTCLRGDALKQCQAILERATDRNMLKRYANCEDFKAAFMTIGRDDSAQAGSAAVDDKPTERCFITLGREGCDICFNDPECKISRHHAEIEWHHFAGGSELIFRDESTNGSLVGQTWVHHDSYRISLLGPKPDIWLAGIPKQKVDWDEVLCLLKERQDKQQKQQPSSKPQTMAGSGSDHPSADTFDSSLYQPSELPDIATHEFTGELPEELLPNPSSGMGRALRLVLGILLILLGLVCVISSQLPHNELGIVRASILAGFGGGLLAAGISLIRSGKRRS